MTNEEIVAKLKTSVCEITFEKADGSTRTMFGTLLDEHIPEVQNPRSGSFQDCITVYDLEENSWRAFKPSKLISIE
jgi:hypothetical protein